MTHDQFTGVLYLNTAWSDQLDEPGCHDLGTQGIGIAFIQIGAGIFIATILAISSDAFDSKIAEVI